MLISNSARLTKDWHITLQHGHQHCNNLSVGLAESPSQLQDQCKQCNRSTSNQPRSTARECGRPRRISTTGLATARSRPLRGGNSARAAVDVAGVVCYPVQSADLVVTDEDGAIRQLLHINGSACEQAQGNTHNETGL